MEEIVKKELEELCKEENWKNKNKEYIKNLQRNLDLIENIPDKNLKERIKNQSIKTDVCITHLAIEAMKTIIKNISSS